jgi:hypothetical protein
VPQPARRRSPRSTTSMPTTCSARPTRGAVVKPGRAMPAAMTARQRDLTPRAPGSKTS